MNFTKTALPDNACKTALLSLALALMATASSSAQVASQSTNTEPATEPTSQVVVMSDIVFQPLNPARGDASPQAGVLWGDITKNVPSGVLLKFADGFSSPPHIHNITYRAVVISGTVYNGDPDARKVWMGPGSFWTQPAGEPHITAAAEGGATGFLEILEGPYLVEPTTEAFDNGERPVNLDKSNIVWLDATDVTWIDQPGGTASAPGPKMAFLWGSPQEGRKNGTFLQLPAGLGVELRGNGSVFHAVVIQGQTRHQLPGRSGVDMLEPGSYFGSEGKAVHKISCEASGACIIYVHTEGGYDVVPS